MHFRRAASLFLVLATSISLTACGSEDETSSGDGLLAGAELTVASKSFAESLLLGHMTILLLENEGASVEDQTGIESSGNARKALTSGTVDIYWEYTGTAWITYLNETEPLNDPQAQYEAVAENDLKKNNIKWLTRAPLNNTYALAANGDTVEEYGVEKLSDLGPLLEQNPSAVTICVESEFAARNDGLPGVLKAYGLEDIPSENIKTIGEAIIYTELRDGGLCNFGEVFATDARIAAFDLTVLEDDKGFFPVYNAAPTLRQETYKKYPEIERILEPVAKKLDNETMTQLNAQVDVEGRSPEDVAQEWLEEQDLL